MSNQLLWRGSVLVLLAVACGGPRGRTDSDVDPYNGVIDNTFGVTTFDGALADQFQPSSTSKTVCNGASACYYPQKGAGAGKTITFFNAGVIKGSTPSIAPASCDSSGRNCVYDPSIATQASDGGRGWHVDSFPNSCTAAPYNRVVDAYRRDVQFPIADALPLNNGALTNPKPTLGVVEVWGVTGVKETCNDLKYSDSISEGRLGARRSAKPTGYETWFVFDPTVQVQNGNDPKAKDFALIAPAIFWFNGLQANYLSGGPIPTDANGNLVAMDGVILDPSSPTSFSSATADNVVLLPFQPGDPSFSPIVRLHDYHTSKTFSSFKGVCLPGDDACAAAHGPNSSARDYVLLSDASTSVFNTIFIVASPQ